jgi:hypothetical protein
MQASDRCWVELDGCPKDTAGRRRPNALHVSRITEQVLKWLERQERRRAYQTALFDANDHDDHRAVLPTN